TLIEMALAFVLEHPAVPAAPIVARTRGPLEAQPGAVADTPPPDRLDRLDGAVPPRTRARPAAARRQRAALATAALPRRTPRARGYVAGNLSVPAIRHTRPRTARPPRRRSSRHRSAVPG